MKEIIRIVPVTPVPQAPPYLKGIINLRGKLIPVADLRTKLGMREAAHTDRTCIIVLEIARRGSTFMTGMVVDSVSEVLHIQGANIEGVHVNFHTDNRWLLGMAKTNNGLKIILDVDEMLGDLELAGAPQVLETAV